MGFVLALALTPASWIGEDDDPFLPSRSEESEPH